MTSFADVIILSSSPSTSPCIPTRLASNTVRESRILPEATKTPSTPSPSEPFLPPSRSRFFDVPTRKDDASKKKRPATKTTAPSESKEKDIPKKTRQKARKVTNEPTHDVVEDLEPQSLDSDKTVAKKTAVSQKGRAKPRAKKETGNLKLAGKVTKASKSNDPQTKTGQKTATVQNTPVDLTDTSEPKKPSNSLGKDEVLHLDEAMTRRRDWTPPRETSPQPVDTMDNGTSPKESREFSAKGGFGSILTDYNYSTSGSDAREVSANEGGPTKRRRIELVDPQCQPLHNRNSKEDTLDQGDTSSSSGRQPKRKPKTQKRFTTLTARMTAQYTSNDVEEDLSADDITQYITKSKPRVSKTKTTGNDPELIVLSPDAAFKALDQQDVVFGTCSQLERDDSPETLREIQRAIRASENLAFGERGLSSSSVLEQTARSQSTSSSMSRFTGDRNLWSVAGRDAAGSLVQAETVDNIDLTEPSHVYKKKDAPKTTSRLDLSDDEWLELDNEKADTSRGKLSSSTKPLEPPADSNSPTTAVLASPVQDVQLTAAKSQQATDASQPASMPQYSGFTDAELSRQVAAYGFKSVKGRKKMIDLLQKCWESKHGKASQTVDVSSQPQLVSHAEIATVAPSKTTTNPKAKSKGKTKPKKAASMSTSTSTDAVTRRETIMITSPKRNQQSSPKVGRPPPSSYIDIEEIQDSEDEVFLSPSQVQNHYTEIFSNATTSGQVPSLEIMTKDRPQTPTKRKATASKTSRSKKPSSSGAASKKDELSTPECTSLLDISIQITKAVRAQPQLLAPSSRSRPTWHEKILMYDPIVLEDFTSWLNVEGLGLIGEDREVGTAVVRDWCEGKGICCCWKKNASW
ncbi:uncharacterized protein N7496_001018 [Penicillium cataractarum]|uniref:Structure-specific endonuclease subunit SLX4 n=1 Tax=Penicillium cataractarum TaxID=2100454 RepID=A0A9W9VVH6_9EURO|nr:uncharacterized protein N7496_001018 [Penicillium cataractarum]KAJ5389950.1 hypothetical protein N7496_001018 [Penicillium cataractarum]